jgi:hypothetical protein
MLASQCIQRSPPSFTPVNDGREVCVRQHFNPVRPCGGDISLDGGRPVSLLLQLTNLAGIGWNIHGSKPVLRHVIDKGS